MQLLCPVCKIEGDTQEHALTCTEITQRLGLEDKTLLNKINYSDLFGCLDRQIEEKPSCLKTLSSYDKSCRKRLTWVVPPWLEEWTL